MHFGKTKISFKKADIILFTVLIILAISSFFLYRSLFSDKGAYVEISMNGKKIQTLSLEKNTTFEIKNSEGGINVLHIKNQRAYITSANCTDKLCVHQKAIHMEGESLICLPHKVIVTVVSSKN